MYVKINKDNTFLLQLFKEGVEYYSEISAVDIDNIVNMAIKDFFKSDKLYSVGNIKQTAKDLAKFGKDLIISTKEQMDNLQ